MQLRKRPAWAMRRVMRPDVVWALLSAPADIRTGRSGSSLTVPHKWSQITSHHATSRIFAEQCDTDTLKVTSVLRTLQTEGQERGSRGGVTHKTKCHTHPTYWVSVTPSGGVYWTVSLDLQEFIMIRPDGIIQRSMSLMLRFSFQNGFLLLCPGFCRIDTHTC